jgi:hypothetical protein
VLLASMVPVELGVSIAVVEIVLGDRCRRCPVPADPGLAAVVYAVLVETGLNQTEIGKTIMAATFVTDFGTAAALTTLFLTPNIWMIPFVLVSVVVLTSVVPTAIAQRLFTPRSRIQPGGLPISRRRPPLLGPTGP